jgi:large subunit ribosomal protein L21
MATAIFRTGGRQYRVQEGARLLVDSIAGAAGDKVVFDQVLATFGDAGSAGAAASAKLGKPLVAGAKVEAEILGQRQGDKLIVFKFKRRKRHRKKQGHRQRFTEVKVTAIRP